MDKIEAIKLLSILANGFDPETGEALPHNSACQSLNVVRALFFAIQTIENSQRNSASGRALPANAGAKWTDDEDQMLIAQHRKQITMAQLARAHQRTRGAIQARLFKLGEIDFVTKRGVTDTDE